MNVRRKLWAAGGACLVLVAEACGLTVTGIAPSAAADGAAEPPEPASDGSDRTGDASNDADAANAANDAALTTDADAAVALFASCSDLADNTPAVGGSDGFYDIDPDGPGGHAPLHVYCNMTVAGGGWTLVGRSSTSVPTTVPPFGWRSATGSVTDTTQPYSIDVVGSKMKFTDVLVADRDPASFNIRSRAYTFTVATNFVSAHSGDLVAIAPAKGVLGDCFPDAGPSMLSYAGETSLSDGFFLRDINDTGQHRGLKVNGFDLADYSDCARGGGLDSQQGLLFVR